MPHLQHWKAIATQTNSNGVAKQTIEGSGACLIRVVVPAGVSAPRHHHDHEQIVHVESGTGELETEEGVKLFGPGSVFFFPPGTWHAARFETETVLIETNLRV